MKDRPKLDDPMHGWKPTEVITMANSLYESHGDFAGVGWAGGLTAIVFFRRDWAGARYVQFDKHMHRVRVCHVPQPDRKLDWGDWQTIIP